VSRGLCRRSPSARRTAAVRSSCSGRAPPTSKVRTPATGAESTTVSFC
jgi:hypothetical protein